MTVETGHVFARNSTDLQVGDKFIFRGLKGQPVGDHTIEIFGISAVGQLQVRLTDHSLAWDSAHSVHALPYDLAILLVEQGIWYPADKRELAYTAGGECG